MSLETYWTGVGDRVVLALQSPASSTARIASCQWDCGSDTAVSGVTASPVNLHHKHIHSISAIAVRHNIFSYFRESSS